MVAKDPKEYKDSNLQWTFSMDHLNGRIFFSLLVFNGQWLWQLYKRVTDNSCFDARDAIATKKSFFFTVNWSRESWVLFLVVIFNNNLRMTTCCWFVTPNQMCRFVNHHHTCSSFGWWWRYFGIIVNQISKTVKDIKCWILKPSIIILCVWTLY